MVSVIRSPKRECASGFLNLTFFHFRINHWATEFGEAIYETSAKATGLFDLQTVSSFLLISGIKTLICFTLNIHVMKWGDARNPNLVPNVQLFGNQLILSCELLWLFLIYQPVLTFVYNFTFRSLSFFLCSSVDVLELS